MAVHDLDEQGLPPENLEQRLAAQFHGGTTLQGQVLRALLGHPKRYQELVQELRVQHDANLTAALKALRREGVVAQRIDASVRPPMQLYELTGLGVDVVLLMERLQFTLDISAAT